MMKNIYCVVCVTVTALAVVAFLDYSTTLLVQTATTNGTLCVTGSPCSYTDVVDIRVIVITFKRPHSLSKLLRSLETMEIDGDLAALEIWIDRGGRKASVHQQTIEVASAFNWKGGRTRVHIQVYFARKLKLN